MDKLKFFGEFNMGKEALIRAHKEIVALWNGGSVRFLPDDIEQITASEREIKAILKQIVAVKELFSGITNNKIQKDELS